MLEVFLRRTTWGDIGLETAIGVIRVAVVTRIVVVARVACGTIFAARQRLCDVVYNALLFHECHELIKIVCVVIELKTSGIELELPVK